MKIENTIQVLWIDLFCGAGGTTSGIHLASKVENISTEVIACVNHDEKAILSHKKNHPNCLHLTEDIRDFEVVKKLKKLVLKKREENPECIINIWASLECTNFSKAKGGLPRDADSRTLAEHMFMYVEELNPDYIWFENVVEFMSWGPLDISGKPISRKRGREYLNWVDKMKLQGYRYDWKLINSADHGAYTSRSRWFGQFSKTGFPLSWPEPTHTKKPLNSEGLFHNPLKKWKAVKEVLDFETEGKSIFNRKKPLVENTLKRIHAGLVKFVAHGDEKFLQRYYSGNDMQRNHSVEHPAGVVRTNNCMALVQTDFLLKYNSINGNTGKHVPPSIDDPCPTIAAQSRLGVVNTTFLQSYYGNGNAHSTEEPCPTVTTKDRFSKIEYLMLNYSNGSNVRSVEGPAATIVNNDKHNLIEAEHFLFNPQFKNPGNSVDKPCPVIIARQDKKPLSLVICEQGLGYAIPVYKCDTPTMVDIKKFMACYGITDIKMRMLMVKELLQIQGFPKDYELIGNQTDQKKFIGNSVEVKTAKALVAANYQAIVKHLKIAA